MDDYLSPELDSQWLYPPYRIDDRRAPPSTTNTDDLSGTKNISDFSTRTDLVQANGARTYDEHNLYGSRHAIVTRNALLARRPTKRPFTVARSSFSGTPSALWLGDNLSTWEHYITTIRQMLQFAAISGVGVVGADSCGFGGNTNEKLCARWAWLGAFNTFYRNHNEISSISQEFYRWPITAEAARAAGRWRLKLLDYTYTTVHAHSVDGTPTLWPLSWVHPTEADTVHIESQFYYGKGLLISPVTDENSTSVTFHLPNDDFYNLFTFEKVSGKGKKVTWNNVGFDEIPVLIRGGNILPLRVGESMKTNENRKLPFQIVVAPARKGDSSGELFIDDGESLDVGDAYSDIKFNFNDKRSRLLITGKYGYANADDTKLDSIVFLGHKSKCKSVTVNGNKWKDFAYNKKDKTVIVNNLGLNLNCDITIELK
jgi:alpha-glucosidase